MSAHVILNLFNELRKSDKMWGMPSILSLFRNKFNKFNNTGARMLDSIYHMTLKKNLNHIFGMKMLGLCYIYPTVMGVISLHYVTKICEPQVVYQF